MSAGARRIEKRVPDGLAGALKRTCSAIFFRAARTPLSEGRNGQSGRAETYHGEIGNAREVLAVVIASACPRLRAFFLKFSSIAPGLQSDAETDGLHVARLFSTRTTRKREAMARGGVAFHASFPNLADCAYRNSRLARGVGRARSVATYRARR